VESRRAEVIRALRADPSVVLMAASSEAQREVIVTPVSPGTPSGLPVVEKAGSSEYFNVLGFDLVSGRTRGSIQALGS
jgi:hypothetical protein